MPKVSETSGARPDASQPDGSEGYRRQSLILRGDDTALLIDEAKRIAASLNCKSLEPTSRPCGKCSPCRQIEMDTFPYWFMIAPQGKAELIQIGQIRDMQSRLMSRAGDGQCKVIVLVDAHRMREESQNSLLKTLEEPPDDTQILLLTGQPQNLLPTILSRCKILDIRGEKPVSEENKDLALNVIGAIQAKGYAAVFEKAAFVEDSRKKNLPAFFGALEALLRDGLVESLCAASTGYSVSPDVSGLPSRAGVRASGAAFLEALEKVWQAGYLVERNVNALLILENLFLTIQKMEIRLAEGGSPH